MFYAQICSAKRWLLTKLCLTLLLEGREFRCVQTLLCLRQTYVIRREVGNLAAARRGPRQAHIHGVQGWRRRDLCVGAEPEIADAAPTGLAGEPRVNPRHPTTHARHVFMIVFDLQDLKCISSLGQESFIARPGTQVLCLYTEPLLFVDCSRTWPTFGSCG